MATTQQVRELQEVLVARGNAVTSRTAGTTAWRTAMTRLQDALRQASIYVGQGQGSIPSSVWSSFLTTIQRKSYTVESQEILAAGGRVTAVNMAEEPASSSADREVVAAGSRAGRAAANNAEVVARDDAAKSIFQPGSDYSGDAWETLSTAQRAWAWLSAPGAPVYRKPIVIGAFATGLAITTYVAVKGVK